jgi:EF-P beta-lysylation protein EpmB
LPSITFYFLDFKKTPMITKSAQTLEYSSGWQQALAHAIRDPAVLLDKLSLPATLLPAAKVAAQQFPLRVPLSYLERIEPGNPNDPLLRQVLPMQAETINQSDGVLDPVGDMQAMAAPGVLHKYRGRALLVTTGACAIHCRYCFRRHFPYNESNPLAVHWPKTLEYLQQDTTISEIILSGGDPLSMNDTRLARLISDLEQVEHLQTLRIHSRLPVVLPERVTRGLCTSLNLTRFKTVMVLHSNHPNEIDTAVVEAANRLRQSGAILLNQSVLLKGVNDRVDTLESLSRQLFAADVLPYYLHQFDPVRGAMHFAVEEQLGRSLIRQLQDRLPGYLVPRYVREIAGFESKIPL